MAHGTSRNHPLWAKRGFLAGLGLFLLGAGGEIVGHALFGTLPGWENTLLVDAEILGIALALLAPLVFGLVLPLTE